MRLSVISNFVVLWQKNSLTGFQFEMVTKVKHFKKFQPVSKNKCSNDNLSLHFLSSCLYKMKAVTNFFEMRAPPRLCVSTVASSA